MRLVHYVWELYGSEYHLEGVLHPGFLVGFTLLASPSPGIALNFGMVTLIFWRADMGK
jgi:hypothetical protein